MNLQVAKSAAARLLPSATVDIVTADMVESSELYTYSQKENRTNSH